MQRKISGIRWTTGILKPLRKRWPAKCYAVSPMLPIYRGFRLLIIGSIPPTCMPAAGAFGKRELQGRQESLITAHTILRNSLGRGYIQEFNDRSSLKDRIVFLVNSVEAATGFSGFGAYFTTLLELDALFLNQDRHLNNIALLHTDFGCKPCPIFDCGASFLLDFNLYRPDIETRAFLSKAQCLPFKSSFTRTVHTAQNLYGKQLEVDFARSDIEPLLDAYLDYYPKQFRYLLKERVLTVLLAQKKKLF